MSLDPGSYPAPRPSNAPKGFPRGYHLFDYLVAALVTVALCSNLISASKIGQFGSFTYGAGVLFFPFSYILGDVLTEVYGYKQARKAIWAAFGALLFAAVMSWVVLSVPPAPGWTSQDGRGLQQSWEDVFSSTPRIVLASLTAFLLGEWANAVALAKMKVLTGGRWLWTRTIGSTIIGQGVDSLIFYPVAFLGTWPNDLVVKVMITNYLLKVGVEILTTPLTYVVVDRVKKVEHENYFDVDTNFTLSPTGD